MTASANPKLLFVVGPTASGKSEFAVQLAERAGSSKIEIINCDSIQFFAGVDIGAAKPTAEQLQRAPHRLVGQIAEGATYTAGDFREDALKLMQSNHVYLAVGGSGFYVQALEKGMFDVPEIPASVREPLLEEGATAAGLLRLYEELKQRDPETAAKIQPADRYRIFRSLEILRANPERGTLTEIRARFAAETANIPGVSPKAPEFEALGKIGIFRARETLRKRVEERTCDMIKNGLIEEVESLRAKGLKTWAPLNSVGYKEVQAYLDGTLPRHELESLIVTRTMQLAKRQMTWFKRDPEIRWFDSEMGLAAPLEFALALLSRS